MDGSKDAADEALLAEAQRLAADGCRRFVVASNDSRFARPADHGDLEIVIWASQKPRKNYTARASQVHRLPIPAAPEGGSGDYVRFGLRVKRCHLTGIYIYPPAEGVPDGTAALNWSKPPEPA
ncbi:hypothetical protein ACQP2X_12880 [Actinoplanes sp. CA-131856]